MAVVKIDDDVAGELRDFAETHNVTQVQLVAALIRRLGHRKIDMAEVIEEARDATISSRRRG